MAKHSLLVSMADILRRYMSQQLDAVHLSILLG